MSTPPPSSGPNWLLNSAARARWLAVFAALAVIGLVAAPLFGPAATDAIFSACFATVPALLGPMSRWAGWSTFVALVAAIIDLLATPGSVVTFGPNFFTDWVPILLRAVAIVFGVIFIVKSSAGDPETESTWRHFKDIAKSRPVQLPVILAILVIVGMIVLSLFLGVPLSQS